MAKVQTNLGASVRMPPYTVTYVTWIEHNLADPATKQGQARLLGCAANGGGVGGWPGHQCFAVCWKCGGNVASELRSE